MLLYGPPKTGKSAGAGSTPGLIGYLNTEQPNSTEYVHERDTDNRIMEVRMTKDPKPILSEVMRSCFPKTGTGFDTWVLDSVGELHRRLLHAQSRGAVPHARRLWRRAREVEDFCRFMVEAPCNFVIVAHDNAVKDETTGAFKSLPFTGTSNPSVAKKLLGMVDVIGYTGAIAVETRRRSASCSTCPARSRRGTAGGRARPLQQADHAARAIADQPHRVVRDCHNNSDP